MSKHRLPTRERQYKHILESYLDRGMPYHVAVKIAAATANKTRARLAKAHRGPKLVGRGGSRHQWYPGKGKVTGREAFVCLEHKRRFKTKAGLLAHYRAHRV